MAITLATILGNVVKEKGTDLTKARKDLKELRQTIAGIKASRKLIAPRLRELKAERLAVDRQGGGAKSAAITSELKFLRQVLNDLTEELIMVCWKRKTCAMFINALYEEVKAIDTEWEKAKAAEVVEAPVSEVANEESE